MVNAPVGPVVNAGTPPACMTIAPSTGLVPSVTTPVIMNVSGRVLELPELTVALFALALEDEASGGPQPEAPALPMPEGGSEEHAAARVMASALETRTASKAGRGFTAPAYASAASKSQHQDGLAPGVPLAAVLLRERG